MWARSCIPIEGTVFGKAMSYIRALQGVDDFATGAEDAIGEPVRAQMLPDVLDRVQELANGA